MKQNQLINDDVIISAKQIHYTYEDGTKALQGIDLEIKRGHKIAFLGANGSGKSTFFLCLNGIHKPQKGQLYFNNIPYHYSRKGLLDLRGKVGIVFQDPDNQLFSASVYQEISFGILNLGVDGKTAKETIEQVIDRLKITPFREKPTHALSGGQKKQVSVADIVVMKPEVIILDEPSAALDPKHAALVNAIIDELTHQGITVIVSTHDMDFALGWADDVVLFHHGQVLMQGAAEYVFSNPSILAKTHLTQPPVIKLFELLCKKGILKPSLPMPRTLKTLESYIQDVNNQIYPGGNLSMETTIKKAILVVSFGTSFNDTRKKTIDVIESDIAAAYPDHTIYRAWTSQMIIKKLKARDNVHISTVSEAMEKMISSGITHIIVQPTHIINGIENDRMKEDILKYQNQVASISFGTPLLTTDQDNISVIHALMKEFSFVSKKEVLVFMGHGTTHYANAVYAALDYTFKDLGYDNVFVGTVEAYPTMETLLKLVEQYNPSRVILTPFMIVAGDHATNDMASDNKDSWKCQFEEAGFIVDCILKGLGEYKGIRELFLQHIEAIL